MPIPMDRTCTSDYSGLGQTSTEQMTDEGDLIGRQLLTFTVTTDS